MLNLELAPVAEGIAVGAKGVEGVAKAIEIEKKKTQQKKTAKSNGKYTN